MDASPLNKLPAELRLEIYALVLTQRLTVPLVRASGGDRLIHNKRCATEDGLLAITETCKMVRQESLPVFYHHNDFWFPNSVVTTRFDLPTAPLEAMNVNLFGDWLGRIGKDSAASIKSLTFDLCSVYNQPGLDTESQRQKRWWIVAQMAGKQIADTGLSQKCKVSARVYFDFTPLPDLYCAQDDDIIIAQNNIGMILPTKSMQAAVAVVEDAVSVRMKEYEAHRHHDRDDCDVAFSLSRVVKCLETGPAAAVRAMVEQGEVERGVM